MVLQIPEGGDSGEILRTVCIQGSDRESLHAIEIVHDVVFTDSVGICLFHFGKRTPELVNLQIIHIRVLGPASFIEVALVRTPPLLGLLAEIVASPSALKRRLQKVHAHHKRLIIQHDLIRVVLEVLIA